MTHWHTDSFNLFPIGDGYEVDVNEFDYQDDNGICYEKDGVVIRHWRRAHGKDGASAYRLDWNGLSFVWTGDGRPDANTTRFAKGVDVFVSELQPDTMNIQALKFGIPPIMGLVPIDVAHTVHYAAGYMFKQVQPRLAMATHLSYDEELVPEMVAGVRTHWDGLFQFGAPDGVIVNVTKTAIWTRKAALPESTNFARPSAKEAIELFDLSLTKTTVDFPNAGRITQTSKGRSRAMWNMIRSSTTHRMFIASPTRSGRTASRSTSKRWYVTGSYQRSRQYSAATTDPTETAALRRRVKTDCLDEGATWNALMPK